MSVDEAVMARAVALRDYQDAYAKLSAAQVEVRMATRALDKADEDVKQARSDADNA